MSKAPTFGADCVTPILAVRDLQEAISYFTEKLGFKCAWQWGEPPSFGCVSFGKVEIFLSQGGQGQSGTWLSVFMEDVDAYHAFLRERGAEIVRPPKDEVWGVREMQVRDPNGHVLRFGQGIPCREPALPVTRVTVSARLEERLAALMAELAQHQGRTLGELLEEMILHSFEPLPSGGVASPHTSATQALIQELRQKHGITYDCHASYRFTEIAQPPPAGSGS